MAPKTAAKQAGLATTVLKETPEELPEAAATVLSAEEETTMAELRQWEHLQDDFLRTPGKIVPNGTLAENRSWAGRMLILEHAQATERTARDKEEARIAAKRAEQELLKETARRMLMERRLTEAKLDLVAGEDDELAATMYRRELLQARAGDPELEGPRPMSLATRQAATTKFVEQQKKLAAGRPEDNCAMVSRPGQQTGALKRSATEINIEEEYRPTREELRAGTAWYHGEHSEGRNTVKAPTQPPDWFGLGTEPTEQHAHMRQQQGPVARKRAQRDLVQEYFGHDDDGEHGGRGLQVPEHVASIKFEDLKTLNTRAKRWELDESWDTKDAIQAMLPDAEKAGGGPLSKEACNKIFSLIKIGMMLQSDLGSTLEAGDFREARQVNDEILVTLGAMASVAMKDLFMRAHLTQSKDAKPRTALQTFASLEKLGVHYDFLVDKDRVIQADFIASVRSAQGNSGSTHGQKSANSNARSGTEKRKAAQGTGRSSAATSQGAGRGGGRGRGGYVGNNYDPNHQQNRANQSNDAGNAKTTSNTDRPPSAGGGRGRGSGTPRV
jgi:hypothetical protein